jgi:sugar lactone lactonase YvrE
MGREPQVLLEGGDFFEGPRWRDGRWWVSDFYRRTVYSVDPGGSTEEVVHVEGQPSGLGWLPDGSLLVVSMKDHRLWRRTSGGQLVEHADLTPHAGRHSNDLVVDAEGRAYVGNFGFDLMAGADPEPTALVRVDPDGTVSVAAEDLHFPNGMLITPDGGTLLVGETTACRYTAFTIGAGGELTDRRVWAQITPAPSPGTFAEVLPQIGYAPDGCALDAEGCVWSADAVGGRCCRIAEGGEILETIRPAGGLGAFACMLGGEDGRTLLLCTAPDFAEHERAGTREAQLQTVQVDVPHAGRP